MTQYAAVKFGPEGKRFYTYEHDIPSLKVGDEVRVPTPRAKDGSWTRATVVELDVAAPTFEVKKILGLAPPQEEAGSDGDG